MAWAGNAVINDELIILYYGWRKNECVLKRVFVSLHEIHDKCKKNIIYKYGADKGRQVKHLSDGSGDERLTTSKTREIERHAARLARYLSQLHSGTAKRSQRLANSVPQKGPKGLAKRSNKGLTRSFQSNAFHSC